MFKDLKKAVMEVGKKAVDLAAEAATEGSKMYKEMQEKEALRRAEQEKALHDLQAEHLSSVPRFKVGSNYHGGYPGQPNIIDGGTLYLTDNELVWLKQPLAIKIPYTDIYDLDLANFKVSGVRSLIAGGSDNDVHQLKNTVVVICRIEGVKQKVKFEIGGALTIHGGALNAQKVIDHLADFRGKFAQEQAAVVAVAAPAVQQTTLMDELQKLAALYEKGLIDDEEFKALKQKLIQTHN